MPLPKSKEGVLDDMDEDEEKVVAGAGDFNEEDNDVDKDTGVLPVALQRELSKLSIH